MSSSTIDVLRHILDEAVYLTEHSGELTKAEFIQDETLRRAFSRSVEVIGEAAKQVLMISDRGTARLIGEPWLACVIG